jgi:hypothetical protein
LSALGTDQHPPFSLRVKHRGLVLIKWWLLAIPHYLMLAVFFSGGWRVFMVNQNEWAGFMLPSLIAVVLVIAVLALLFTGRYPDGLYDLVIGINRWVLRVRALHSTYARRVATAAPRYGSARLVRIRICLSALLFGIVPLRLGLKAVMVHAALHHRKRRVCAQAPSSNRVAGYSGPVAARQGRLAAPPACLVPQPVRQRAPLSQGPATRPLGAVPRPA